MMMKACGVIYGIRTVRLAIRHHPAFNGGDCGFVLQDKVEIIVVIMGEMMNAHRIGRRCDPFLTVKI